jgi:hypothetical protein
MDWHRLFGLVLTDFFTGSPFAVELEKDLSRKKQLLDIIILRKQPGDFTGRLPDGLEDLVAHNLLTFKSHQEALTDWALKELTGHYVNYRKQVSPSLHQLVPEEEFRLYAVCAHFPHNLAGSAVWVELRPGIYECRRGTDAIRVLVLRQLPQNPHNALWHLFSAAPAQVGFGVREYQQHSAETSTLLYELFKGYLKEGLAVPYTLADFRRDFRIEFIREDLTPEERRELLATVSPEERLKGLPPEERLKGLPPEERLKGLSAEEIERYLKRLKAEQSAGHQAPPAE